MAVHNGKATETVSGEVEATNPRGIRLGGTWYNFSQFGAARDVPRPASGDHVSLTAQATNGRLYIHR